MSIRFRRLVCTVFALTASAFPSRAWADVYLQTNLVSDVPGLAPVTDPNLKNAWGISESGGSPFWVSDANTNKATLYNTFGAIQGLVVAVPSPTGQVFNSTASDFVLSDGAKAAFIFASLNGSIYGWNGGAGTTALLAAPGPGGASYDGLGLGTATQGSVLYAANNVSGKIDVYSSTFAPTTLAGSFTDPNLPAGFLAYNVQNLGGTVYVTYNGATGGVVDAFDQNGNFLRRIASNGAGGPLNNPWGVAVAPPQFGQFAGDLLVGNRASGTIDAFNPNATNDFRGVLTDKNGNPIVNSGLWGLQVGNGGNGGNANTLYFAAGINGYADGLFGAITFVPEPGPMALLSVGLALSGGMALWRRVASLRRRVA